MQNNDKYVIITAGGAGTRMKATLPKQFMVLHKKPILMHTINIFLRFASDIQIILVLPADQLETWEMMCQKHRFMANIKIVSGGPSRFHSVKNGLKLVPENALVAIHDGVRPLVSLDTIQRCFKFAERFGNAIPVMGVTESVRIVNNAFSSVVNRDTVKLVQTPQTFKSSIIKAAYNTNYYESFTDDASVLEKAGERIFLVDGNRENIKITTPFDLTIAEALLNSTHNKKEAQD